MKLESMGGKEDPNALNVTAELRLSCDPQPVLPATELRAPDFWGVANLAIGASEQLELLPPTPGRGFCPKMPQLGTSVEHG